MRRFFSSILTGVLATGLAGAAHATDLTLRRVLLSSGGVGQFEWQGELRGTDVLTLDIRRDQVDDVLKSLLVVDPAGGAATVRLPGEAPLQEALRDLPVPPQALDSLLTLLAALKGALVTVATGAGQHAGALLGLREDADVTPEGVPMPRHRMALLGAGGLEEIPLEAVTQIQFVDPALRIGLAAALAAHAAHATPERRRLQLLLPSAELEPRRVQVAYVVEAPLWKTAYRLMLDADGPSGRPAEGWLQGWAILENRSGIAWEKVELMVAAGAPVALRQALYPAYAVSRPEVPLEVNGRVLPAPDSGSISLPVPGPAPVPAGVEAPPPPPSVPAAKARAGRRPPAAPPESGSLEAASPEAGLPDAASPETLPPSQQALPGGVDFSVAAISQTASQVLYRHPLPISLNTGETLLIPLVNQAVVAERVALYQPHVHARHPLAAVRLRNPGSQPLPAGILTLYEEKPDEERERHNEKTTPAADRAKILAFAGDARLGWLPVGDERLLSFALEPQVMVLRDEGRETQISVRSVADGIVSQTRLERQKTRYTVQNSGPARILVLEHPGREGWELLAPEGAVFSRSETGWRLTLALPAAATLQMEVALQHPTHEQFALATLTPERLMALAQNGPLPESARQQLARIQAVQAAITAGTQTLSRLEAERTALIADQERLRANLEAVGRTAALGKRYLARLAAQEQSLENLDAQIRNALQSLESSRQELSPLLRAFRL